MSARRLVSSGSRFEPEIGFSRAVRVGAHISVAGTAPVSATGGNAALGDVYGQTKLCLEIIDAAIVDRPASTFVQVSRFIDPQWLVEIEADAIAL